MIFAMSSISLLGSVVWGHHMYTVGMEIDTRAYFSGVTIMISLPTGTKIFNWLSTYLSSHPQLTLSASNDLYALMFLLRACAFAGYLQAFCKRPVQIWQV